MGPTSRQRKPDSKLLGYWPAGLIRWANIANPSQAARPSGVRPTSQRRRPTMAVAPIRPSASSSRAEGTLYHWSRAERSWERDKLSSDFVWMRHDPPCDGSAGIAKCRFIQLKELHVLKFEPADVPQPEAGPLRIVVGPPSHTHPLSLFVYSPSPCPAA